MTIRRVAKDKGMIKNILDMTNLIQDRMKKDDKDKFMPLIISDYYEIIKELITALLLCDGYKTTSHLDLIKYLKKNYNEFTLGEILFLDRLRILRNRVVYEGLNTPSNYLYDNENIFLQIINKLRSLINLKLKNK